jgi:hypothetical protein
VGKKLAAYAWSTDRKEESKYVGKSDRERKMIDTCSTALARKKPF